MKTSPQTSFEKLLACLSADRDRAGEIYEELRLKLVKFFSWKNCSEGELHADEVFDRIARRLDEGIEVQNVNAYAYQVARFVVLEQYRQPVIEELPRPEPEPQNPRMDCLEECLTTLPEPDRALILSYYEGEGGEKGAADFKPRDKRIDLKEWLEYAVERVPSLYDEILTGKLRGINRAELVGSAGGRRSYQQQPSLFDFSQNVSNVLPMRSNVRAVQ